VIADVDAREEARQFHIGPLTAAAPMKVDRARVGAATRDAVD